MSRTIEQLKGHFQRLTNIQCSNAASKTTKFGSKTNPCYSYSLFSHVRCTFLKLHNVCNSIYPVCYDEVFTRTEFAVNIVNVLAMTESAKADLYKGELQ